MHPVADAPNRSMAFATALFEELSRAGVRHVCVCPGSRSAPLAAAAARQPELRCWSHVDERSAGFFALGLARATRAPVALVCTSGTAAANFHPAVIEAHYGGVPLVVLTADRPHELRDWGAGQTIDQTRIYGSHVRWYAEAPPPDASSGGLRYARALACRAIGEALGAPAGPVHLNLPFREPLDPTPVAGDVPQRLDSLAAGGRDGRPYTRVRRTAPAPDLQALAELAELAAGSPRGVIACGPLDAHPDLPAAVTELGAAAGWPVLADPASQLRCGPHVESGPVVAASDLLLRSPAFAEAHAPELVVRIGAPPTSKAFRLWLERQPPERLLVIDPDDRWQDPSHLGSEIWRADPVALCDSLRRRLASREVDGAWLQSFVRADLRAKGVVERLVDAEPRLLAPRAVRELAALLPDDAILYLSNSMPIRDADSFLPASRRPLRVLCNRGANGIDGVLSSAVGAAAAGKAPVVLLTGDLAFVHDAGGLLAARRHGIPLVIVVIDDGGGGIFSYLPIAGHAEAVDFEELFRVPHGLDLGALAHGWGADHTRVSSWDALRAAVKDGLATPGASVIEIPVDRDRNVAHHRAIERAVAEALAADARTS